MIWTVPRVWVGETCVILAGGLSLEGFHPRVLMDARPRVITISDSWQLFPGADVHYFCDETWFQEQWSYNYLAWVDGGISFRHLLDNGAFWVKGGAKIRDSRIHSLRFTGQIGLETDPGGLRTGSNSGYQAINLAYHYGVKRIILLGYDMHARGERTHWHARMRVPPKRFRAVLSEMLPLFSTLVEPLREAGVSVVNATPGSDLTCWPLVSLEDALRGEGNGI